MIPNEAFDKILIDLKKSGDIDASAIASREGLLISSIMPRSYNPETFAAMSATMLGAAETATMELNKGFPEMVIAESSHGKLIAKGAGRKALLIIMTKPGASLGLILVELDKAASKIKNLLGE